MAHRLGQPPLIGYILAGVLVGPHTAGPTVVEIHDIELLAEIGVALLLFALGLELRFADLKPVRRLALIGGPLQILVSALLGYVFANAVLGWERVPAAWMGAMVALSSTMVVLKILMGQGRTGSLAGRAMIGRGARSPGADGRDRGGDRAWSLRGREPGGGEPPRGPH